MILQRIYDQNSLRIEELSYNSWPALLTFHNDGWIMRFANGFTDRCNSVWPLYRSSINLKDKAERCEAIYKSCNQPVIFRITSDINHIELDKHLERMYYVVKTPTIVQILNIAKLSLKSVTDDITISNIPNYDWIRDVADVTKSLSLPNAYQAILRNINLPLGLARIKRNGRVVALGLGVIDDKYLGLYGLNTLPSFRRQGLAHKLITALLKWGQNNNAELAYLHVEADNNPARPLYDSMGFKDVYQYWYRQNETTNLVLN